MSPTRELAQQVSTYSCLSNSIRIGNTTVREELIRIIIPHVFDESDSNTMSAKHKWYFSLSSNTSGIIH